MISTRPEFSGHFPNGFRYSPVDSMQHLAEWMSKGLWSNMLWAGGHRREENFLSSHYCVFDYDEGLPISEALKMFDKYQFVLGTTKSHQKYKGPKKPACDRYRITIPWVNPIATIDMFRFNMKKAIGHFKSDPVAYDGARLWQPCHKIVKVQEEGRLMPVQTKLPDDAKQENLNKKFEDVKKYYEETNSIPAYARDFLEGIYSVGEINSTLFKTCIALFNRGMTIEQVTDTMSKLPQLKGHTDLKSTVRSARRISER